MAQGDSVCLAWPTRRVRAAIQEGWLSYRGPAAASQGQRRRDITVEHSGQLLDASLERQLVSNLRAEIQAELRDQEARHRGTWLHVPVDHWDAHLEAELRRRLEAHRRERRQGFYGDGVTGSGATWRKAYWR